jgi:CBS domain-containing protein
MNIPISAMMTKQTKTVMMDDSVAHAEEIMRANQISALPVVESADGAIIGIISLGDLMRFHQKNSAASAVRAWEICTYKPVEMSPDVSISDVARTMVSKGIHHILISENKHLVGIVSALDFVKKCIQD